MRCFATLLFFIDETKAPFLGKSFSQKSTPKLFTIHSWFSETKVPAPFGIFFGGHLLPILCFINTAAIFLSGTGTSVPSCRTEVLPPGVDTKDYIKGDNHDLPHRYLG